MSGHRKWSAIRVSNGDGERQALIEQEARLTNALLSLFQMRERRGVSQEELARIWDTSQPNVSKIERQGDLLVSTLRRYVEALGGQLEVQAVFPIDRWREQHGDNTPHEAILRNEAATVWTQLIDDERAYLQEGLPRYAAYGQPRDE